MRRRIAVATGAVALALAPPATAFHHGFIPAGACAAAEIASSNPTARERLREHGLFPPAIPPNDTPAEEVVGSTPAEQNCANAED